MDRAVAVGIAVAGVVRSTLHSGVLPNLLLIALLASVASRLDAQEGVLRGIYRRLSFRETSSKQAAKRIVAGEDSWEELEDEDDEDDDPLHPPLSELVREELAIRRGELPTPPPWWKQHLVALIVLSAIGIPSSVAWVWFFAESFVAAMTLVSLGFAVVLWLKWVDYIRADFKALGKPIPWWARETKG